MKYGLDCWMMEEEGKCRAEAEARGLPEEEGWKKGRENSHGEVEEEERGDERSEEEKNTMRLRSLYCFSLLKTQNRC